MTDDRLLIPQDPEYFAAMGLATIAFARLEWDAVWCCERMQPGYIGTIEEKRKTAGKIASDLKAISAQWSEGRLVAHILPLAEEFGAVVEERNGLLHGKPGTAPGGAVDSP
ncbi:hypothetical protein FQK02_09665 [Xanthomonas vasicola]|uniref:Uncharacterized protein n=1 Tax=Xanthomonas vasicola pv. vasculorum NCPPB 890 TaxID=1184265 RepID=A0A836ZSB8_XANVA|nr:hypothetical protein [Xanthomonas vasicola]KFA27290.1 hypothetical protein KW5_0112605 [Xanthomonas vasicola pv. vasculorum NCPPB 1326]KFA31804.1 hypothetical protein KWG_0109380 [Xanthomonas vasicola pv. vasculorum NCPPB 1381]MBV6747942.1 hypothetical protein [Xanthomonas vasicola pv. vasculorum NCPPB 890]MBV6893535.1 hypothetical protein [Xanthomonas vasicola pv. vasculorum]MDO6949614.1 hypothetical protein [Xanthomonas vasicola]